MDRSQRQRAYYVGTLLIGLLILAALLSAGRSL